MVACGGASDECPQGAGEVITTVTQSCFSVGQVCREVTGGFTYCSPVSPYHVSGTTMSPVI